MSGIYEKVIKNTKKIESLIEEKLNAEGKGLYEKTVSVEGKLEQEIVRKIRRIAKIRNKLMHEDTFELADTVSFEEDCKEVIYYLSTTEFDSTVAPASKAAGHSPNSRVCKSCGADTKPILRIKNGGYFRKETKRHICAICGEDMYITGGGWTWFAQLLLGIFVLNLFVGTLKGFMEGAESVGFSGFIPILILFGVFYWWWKRSKKKKVRIEDLK